MSTDTRYTTVHFCSRKEARKVLKKIQKGGWVQQQGNLGKKMDPATFEIGLFHPALKEEVENIIGKKEWKEL